MKPNLSPHEAAVVQFVLERAPVRPAVQITSVSFKGDPENRKYNVARTPLLPDQQDPLGQIHVVFTVGSYSRRIFVCVSDGDPEQMSEILANVERHDSTVAHFHPEDTFQFENDYMKKNGRAGLIIFYAGAMLDLPNRASVSGHEVTFSLVVFLDDQEYRLCKERGIDALMERLDSPERDRVRFNAVLH